MCVPLRCSGVSFVLCWVSLNLLGASSGGLGSSLDGLGVSLKHLKTSFGDPGAYLSSLGASVRALEVSFFFHFLSFWGSLRGSRKSRDLRGPLFSKMGAPP